MLLRSADHPTLSKRWANVVLQQLASEFRSRFVSTIFGYKQSSRIVLWFLGKPRAADIL